MFPLLTDRVRIEPLGETDAQAFAEYRQNPDIARWQSWTTGFSISDAFALIRSQPVAIPPPPGDWLQLAVHSPDSSVLYGDIAVHSLADQPDTYEVGFTFAPAHHGRGLATEALARVVGFLVQDQSAHRIVAFCDTRNTAAAALLRRLHFRQESHQVEADYFKQEWTSIVGFALLARELTDGPMSAMRSQFPLPAG